MRPVLFLVLFHFFFTSATAQQFSGHVYDAKSKEPIPYMNIGIVGKGIGTVSDLNGHFSIILSDSIDNQSIRFSCIGYKSLVFKCHDFRTRYADKEVKLYLEENTVILSQVVVKPKIFKTKVLGNTNHSRNASAGFMSNDLGSELGTVMHIKRAPTFLENVNFNIANNMLDSVKFRLNIYSMKNGVPDSVILKEPIYVTTTMHNGTLSVDLKKYDLWVNSDFFVSLEWIEDYGKNKLYFCAGLTAGDLMYRKTSQDDWHKAAPIGVGFNATVTYEK
jgi:hypothetical protein